MRILLATMLVLSVVIVVTQVTVAILATRTKCERGHTQTSMILAGKVLVPTGVFVCDERATTGERSASAS